MDIDTLIINVLLIYGKVKLIFINNFKLNKYRGFY